MSAIVTYKTLQDECLANLDETGDTGTTLTLVKNFLNQAHVKRLASRSWPFLRWQVPQTLTMVASQRVYGLHSEFWRPTYFYNRNQNAYLVELPERHLQDSGVNWISDTSGSFFRYGETWPVKVQPSSGSVITIVSSSAADSGSSKAITLRGDTASELVSETITPSGVTPVAGTTTFTKILGVTKAAAWTGTLTMTSNAAAVTNLTLPGADFGRQYRTIELLSLPTANEVVEYQFFRQPVTLSADNDVPDIPSPHSRILVWDALLMMAGYLTQTSAQAVGIWAKQQADMEADLLQTFLPGQTIAALPATTRGYTEDWDY